MGRKDRQVILHIGMHKTGSTAVQTALGELDPGTVRYADLGFANHSIPVYTAFSAKYRTYPIWTMIGLSGADIEKKRDDALQAITAALDDNRWETLIISGEDISLLSRAEVAALAGVLRSRGHRVRILAYVRAPMAFIQSATAEHITSNTFTGLELPRYRDRFEPFIDIFGRETVTFRLYRKPDLASGDVVADCFGFCGLRAPRELPRALNASPSTAALRCIHALNQVGGGGTGNPLLLDARFRFIDAIRALFPGSLAFPESVLLGAVDAEDVAWMAHAGEMDLSEERLGCSDEQTDLGTFLAAFDAPDLDALDAFSRERAVAPVAGRIVADLIEVIYRSFLPQDSRASGL